jgi:hypothetical protein
MATLLISGDSSILRPIIVTETKLVTIPLTQTDLEIKQLLSKIKLSKINIALIKNQQAINSLEQDNISYKEFVIFEKDSTTVDTFQLKQ